MLDYEDNTVSPRNKKTEQYVLLLKNDTGFEVMKNNIKMSDFNLLERYEEYEEDDIDNISAQLVIQHERNRFIDIYFYEKEKSHETRHVQYYKKIHGISYKSSHTECTSRLELQTDNDYFIVLPECPIEFCTWLSSYLFST